MDNDLTILPEEPRPTRSDAIKNRELLIQTARALFNQHGVESITMSAIAAAAGVGKGTLYRHFENKIDLCLALLDQNMREFQNETLCRLQTIDSPIDNLRWFLDAALRYVTQNEPLLCGTLEGSPNLIHPAHWWWRQTIHALLGRINPQKDAEYFADVFYIMLDIRTIRLQRHVSGYNEQRILNGLLDLVAQFVG